MSALITGTYVCGSCAVTSISSLGSCKNPIDALQQFCKVELGVPNCYTPSYGKLTCYYIFCAGPEVKSTEVGGTHHSKDHWPKYGTEFAQFLIDNKLGEVVTLGPKKNLRHHPTSTAQVWAWSPDQTALEEWWNKHQKELK